MSDAILKFLSFLLVPLYTHALSPTDYGKVGFLMATTQVLGSFLGFGVIQTLPLLYHSYDGPKQRRLVQTALLFTLVQSTLVCAALASFGEPLFLHFSSEVAFKPLILLAIWTSFFSSIYYLPLGLFNIREEPGRYALFSMLGSIVTLGTTVLLVVGLNWGVQGVLVGNITGSTFSFLLALIAVRGIHLRSFDQAILKTSLRLAAPAFIHVVIATLSRFADRFFIVKWSTLADAGAYSLAATVCSVLLLIQGGLYSALNPHFHKRANANDVTLPRDWARLSSLFAFASISAALGLALFSPELIRLAAPPQYQPASALIPTLSLATMLYGFYSFLSPGIGFKRTIWVYPVASVSSLATTFASNALLIPLFQAQGAALSACAANGVQLFIFFVFSQKIYPIPYEAAKLAILVGTASVVLIASKYVAGGTALVIAQKLSLLVLYFFVLSSLKFFTPQELRSLSHWLRFWRKKSS